jgi:ubiquinone biosynthesis protein
LISVVSAVRDLARLREITAVLARHGFGELVARAGFGRAKKKSADGQTLPPPPDAQNTPEIPGEELARGEEEKAKIGRGERVRLVIQDLGPSFIKLGQIASTRADLVPDDILKELRRLQDDVPPIPYDDVKKVVESSLGAPIESLYKHFDHEPLATASIGQVHRATLVTPDGEHQVVVKVQRPGVAETVARDVELLHILAAAAERAIPEAKFYSPVALVAQFDRSVMSELNYQVEAESAERFAKNFDGDLRIRFPRIYKEVSSKHVLTMEFFDGMKVDKALKNGYSGPTIAKTSVGVIIKMIFEDGFFHADPHPGNIIILGTPEAPVFGLIDLGMVGRLSPELREGITDLMLAAARKDSYAVADALYRVGKPTRKVDMREYRAEVSGLADKYLGRPLKELDIGALLRDLVQGAVKYGIEIPSDFMMAGKALMTLDGIGKQLDPDLDLFGEATPYFTALMKKRYSPQRIGNELIRGVEQLSRVGHDLPSHLTEVLDDLRLGRLSVKATDPQLSLTADRLGRRIFSGLVIASLVGAGAVLVRSDDHPTFGIALLVVAALGWLAHVLADLRRGRLP